MRWPSASSRPPSPRSTSPASTSATASGGTAASTPMARRRPTSSPHARGPMRATRVSGSSSRPSTGILAVDGDGTLQPADGHAAVLVDPISLNLMAPLRAGCSRPPFGQLPAVVDAYRSGDGRRLGVVRRRHARGPGCVQSPGRHAPARRRVAAGHRRPARAPRRDPRLRASRTSACGEGWSTLALARAYPNGRGRRASTSTAHRSRRLVGMRPRPAWPTPSSSATAMPRHSTARSTLALIVEAVHDMSNPVLGPRAPCGSHSRPTVR